MADDSSSVSVVAIIAILILVVLAAYFMFFRGGAADDADLEIDINSNSLVHPTGIQPPPGLVLFG
jgi:hypothetical protein